MKIPMVSIRYVQEEDRNFWLKLDKHLPKAEFEKKIRDKMGYVLLEENIPYGLLRYNLFWIILHFVLCFMLMVIVGVGAMEKTDEVLGK